MPQNDFLPFGTAGGAPVLSQAAWAAATPANGRGAGIVPKEYFNKAIRQPAVFASAFGDFMVAQGQDAIDDGNVPQLTTRIGLALAAFIATSALPTHFFLATTSGGALSRSVSLAPGTWQFTLLTICHVEENGSTYNLTGTQGAHLSSLSISTNVNIRRSGGSGYGRAMNSETVTVNTLVVGALATVTMSMDAVSLPAGMQSRGSMIWAEKIA